MQVVITPHALMSPIHQSTLNVEDFLLHYRLLRFISKNKDFASTYVFPDTIEILSDNNLYPIYKTFSNYLSQYDLDEEISPQDLVTLFHDIMSYCDDLDESNEVYEFEIENGFPFPTISTTPICNKFTNNSIAFCGYLEMVKNKPFLPLLDNNITSNTYSPLISKASVLDGDEVVELLNFQPNVALYTSCTDLMNNYSPSDLWKRSTTDFSYKLAIFYKCKEISRNVQKASPVNLCLDSFEIGSHFIASLESHQCSGSGKFAMTLLDSIARLLLGEPKNEVKVFATSAGGSTPRTKGTDIAYRLHVTKSGEGLRLMFWKKICGTIELANVANKSDIVIY
ncbi:hypothetical protein LDV98_002595 [Vibrio alginolyticus]|uniref:hypothetical protein n=1 Tax=Vibrio alginolyticus TaxID=663 RepID=UPI00354BD63C|nr:hypothetical protein [Vibrio alginolyticus]